MGERKQYGGKIGLIGWDTDKIDNKTGLSDAVGGMLRGYLKPNPIQCLCVQGSIPCSRRQNKRKKVKDYLLTFR